MSCGFEESTLHASGINRCLALDTKMVSTSTSFETDESPKKHHGSNRCDGFTYSDIVKGETNARKKPVSVIVNGNVIKLDPLGPREWSSRSVCPFCLFPHTLSEVAAHTTVDWQGSAKTHS